jgi:uncharacterized lipoprotein YajG
MMKKIITILIAGIFIAACNNAADSESNTDTLVLPDTNDDRNNRNTTVYDSAAGKTQGDTASYERMPGKVSDSTPR